MKKGLILGLIVGIAILIGGGALVYASSQQPDSPTVKTSPLSKSTIQNTVSATGVVESYTKVVISNNSNDTIEKLYVSVGQGVENGDWLCQLYNKETGTYTNVKATATGTITTMSAVKGSTAAGELFTIENTGDLKIRGKVKEADLNKIHESMTVAVKTDATGSQIFPGTLTKIAPSALASDAASNKAEFAIEVDLPADTTGLRIGMNAKLNIITTEKNDVFCVPYEALVKDTSGQTCIYIATKNTEKKGSYVVESIPVSTGLESDSLIEISGEKLVPDLAVIAQPQSLQPGAIVSVEAGKTVS
jgi:HlyD family secretion protein